METLKLILNSSVLSTFIWAMLGFTIFLHLKKPICDLINRIKSAKWGEREFLMEPLRIEASDEIKATSKEGSIFNLVRSMTGLADYVWFGYYDRLVNDHITRTFDSCIRYAKEAGLNQYAEILEQMQKNYLAQIKTLSLQDRNTMFDKIEEINKKIIKELSTEKESNSK